MLEVLPRWAWELVIDLSDHGVSGECFADPVNDGFGCNGCVEAVSQSNRVGSGYATRASACDKQVVFVDEALLDQGVNSRHVVSKVLDT